MSERYLLEQIGKFTDSVTVKYDAGSFLAPVRVSTSYAGGQIEAGADSVVEGLSHLLDYLLDEVAGVE